MNILIVEDSATLRHTMCQYIRNAGHHPIVANNGEEALQIFDAKRVDMIVMDVEMPGLDGFETTRLIREWLEKDDLWLPIIFVTGKNEEEDLRRGIDVGGDDYLIKPVSETILVAKIRAMERIIAMRNELKRLNQSLVELSERDSLTHLFNRRTFDDRAESAWKQAARNHEALAILIMDIDHFKLYNDCYGHVAGDDCIVKVAEAVMQSLGRPGDIVARYGGEEFIAVLTDTREEGAYHVAERIRQNVAALNIRHRESPTATHITVSIGGAVINHTAGTHLRDQINAADKALYASKQAGRNRVTVKLFSPRVRILIADSSGHLARAIDGKLKHYFALLQARSGQETLALARRNRPDVIVMDELLADDDAITTVRRLREDGNTGQIPLLITCNNLERWHSLGLEVDGCYANLDPPHDLIDKLNRMLF
jgi:diguanylate cyclase (GGDEF)-like protein